MKWKKFGAKEWTSFSKEFDFVLNKENGLFILDNFNKRIKNISPEYIADRVKSFNEGEKIQILSPIELKPNEKISDLTEKLKSLGFLRIRLNKTYYNLDEEIPFDNNLKNEIYIVIDRLKVSDKIQTRLLEAINTASKFSDGKLIISSDEQDYFFNLAFACEKTGKSYPLISPQTFSFNSEKGMCLECQGLGYLYGSDILSNPSFLDACILDIIYIFFEDEHIDFITSYFEHLEIDTEVPLTELSKKDLSIFLNGTDKEYKKNNISYSWKGLNTTLAELAKHSSKIIKESLTPQMQQTICPSCKGKRLNPLALNVKINDLSISELCSLTAEKAYDFVKTIKLNPENEVLLTDTLNHIIQSLQFLKEIGLHYISLDRSAPTLSGGEFQRIRLAKQLGSSLTSCIYILDEPTI